MKCAGREIDRDPDHGNDAGNSSGERERDLLAYVVRTIADMLNMLRDRLHGVKTIIAPSLVAASFFLIVNFSIFSGVPPSSLRNALSEASS